VPRSSRYSSALSDDIEISLIAQWRAELQPRHPAGTYQLLWRAAPLPDAVSSWRIGDYEFDLDRRARRTPIAERHAGRFLREALLRPRRP
jgi:hypothetical protein